MIPSSGEAGQGQAQTISEALAGVARTTTLYANHQAGRNTLENVTHKDGK